MKKFLHLSNAGLLNQFKACIISKSRTVRQLIASAFLAAIFLSASIVAKATDYYVSTTGNDATGDGSVGTPWKTILFAVNNIVVVTGDVIHVEAGSYDELVTISKSITLSGANAGIHPTVGTHPTAVVGSRVAETIISHSGFYAFSPAADNIVIDGFEFTGDGGRIIDTYSNASGFHLTNCIFGDNTTSTGTGRIQFGGGIHNNMLIDYNLILDRCESTIYTGGTTASETYNNFTVQYNKFQSEGNSIFWTATAPLTNGVVDHNEFDGTIGGIPGTGFSEMNIGNAGNLQITNNWFHNILYNAVQCGIIGGSVSNNIFETHYGLSGFNGAAIQLWGGESGTSVSANVTISNNEIRYNQNGDGPVFGVRLRAPNSASDPPIDGTTIHIHENSFLNGGVRNDAFAILDQGDPAKSVDATCNWYASVSSPLVYQAPTFTGPVTSAPYLTNGTDNSTSEGFQPVPGSCTGCPGGSVKNTTTNITYCSIQAAIDDPLTLNGHTLVAGAGTYNESIVITKQLTLNGPNINTDCSGSRVAEAIINGVGGSNNVAVKIASDKVTVNGFTIKNPTGSYGVSAQGRSNINVDYNIVTDVGDNVSGTGATYGIQIESNAAASSVSITHNCVNNIRGGQTTATSSANGSGAGIGANSTNSAFDLTGLDISYNVISGISASPTNGTGGKGAYGVLINIGAVGTGKAVNATVTNNDISNLNGRWAHGVGLEGNTPNALVVNNAFSSFTTAATDNVAVYMEQNASIATVQIHENSLLNSGFGIGNNTATAVNATCNWFGTTNAVTVAAKTSGPVTYTPFLTNGTDNSSTTGFQPVPGSCTGCPGGSVKNTTTNITYCSIQAAIDDPLTLNGHTLVAGAGTYNESVLVNKQLTIQGAQVGVLAKGRSGAESIVDPNSSAAHGFNIVTDNVTIDGFTITNSAAYPATERYGVVTITKSGTGNFTGINVKNNIISHQFKGVDFNYTDNFEISGNWIHGESDPYNYGCTWVSSYGTTSSNGVMKNNDLDGYGSAIEIQGTLTQPVSNISITENRSTGSQYALFGLQNSTVYRNSALNVTTGSHVFIGGGCSGDVFSENFFDNGSFNGIRITDLGNGINSNLTITNNSITGHNTSGNYEINVDASAYTGIVSATCNWYGTTVASTIASKITGPVNYSPWLTNGTDNAPATPGFQPVPNSCLGCPGGGSVTNINTGTTYCTIQAAIDDPATLNGHTITVGAGTYTEDLTISKSLTIKGANFGVNPCSGSRTAESIVKPATSDYAGGVLINITAPDVTIDGFTIDGDNTSLTSGTVSMGADIDVDYGIYSNANNTKVDNNIVNNIFDWGIFLDGTGSSSFSGEVKHNKIQNIPDWAAIAALENYYTDIEENCMSNVWQGVLVESFYNAKPASSTAAVLNNTVSTSTTSFITTTTGTTTFTDVRGIRVNLHYGSASPWTVSNNIFTNTIAGTTLSRGIQVLSMQSATSLTLSNNKVTGFDFGYDLWNNTTTNSITVSGGMVSNCNTGVFPNNYDGYGPSDAASSAYVVDGVTISGSVNNGIFVKDNPLNSNGATVAAEIKNCSISGGAAGILVSGPDASANIHDNASTVTGAVIGVDVDGGSVTSLFRNNISANGTGVRIKNSGLLTSTTENFIKNNTTDDGIRIENTAGAIGPINNNDLSGNTRYAINNASTAIINATCNWYGSAAQATVTAKTNGPGTYAPWLTNGADNDGTTHGFQPVPASCTGTFTGSSCSILGADGPVCPSSSNYYTAPAGMSSYAWSISGNGTISGSTTSQTVNVVAGANCNASFVLSLTIIDGHQLSTSCNKTVYVIDNTKPVINVAPCAVLGCNPTSTQIAAAFGAATVTDNCSTGLIATSTIGAETGSGCSYSTTKTWKVTDACGNMQTASQTITYKRDSQKPVISKCPSNITCCNSTVTWTVPTASDNCGIQSFTSNHKPGDVFPVGTTTVTYTATDVCGNYSTCSFTVTVNPTPKAGTISGSSTVCVGLTTTLTISGNTIAGTWSSSNTSIATVTAGGVVKGIYAGTVTIKYTVTNSCGSFVATKSITVGSNTPVITCPFVSSCTKNVGASCKYTVSGNEFNATATCGCGVPTLSYTLSGATSGTGTSLAGVQLNKGVTTVTWKAINGSQSCTCSFTVNATDNQKPSITCKPAATKKIAKSATCYTVSGTEFNATASDNCGAPSLIYCLSGATVSAYSSTNTSLAGKNLNVGNTTITWKATDGSNNVSTCTTVITVSRSSSLTGDNTVSELSYDNQLAAANPASFTARVMPNPTSNHFTLQFNSQSYAKIKITVIDVTGRVIEQKTDVPANSTLQLGSKYHPGVYIAEILQDKKKIVLRLIKEGN